MEPTEVRKQGERFTIAEIKHDDIPHLHPILKRWIQWDGQVLRKEINETIAKMSQSAEQSNNPLHPYHYVVLRNSEGDAIGCAGVGVPDDRMYQYKSNPENNLGEMINVFLADEMRGKGLGVELVNAARRKATELGYDELVWNSGPRYKDTAWGFYEKIVGEPLAEAKHYYGIGYHAQVWRVTLP